MLFTGTWEELKPEWGILPDDWKDPRKKGAKCHIDSEECDSGDPSHSDIASLEMIRDREEKKPNTTSTSLE